MLKYAHEQNVDLDLSGKVAAITGGTQGIGAATAVRFAQAGASVYIIGRNDQLGEEVIESLKAAAKDPTTQTFEYIKTDLSLVAGNKALASTLISKAGPSGIDYLICSAGSPPTGKWNLTSEGHEKYFALQIIARFVLSYLLAKSGCIKESILFICSPGGKGATPPDLEDFELVKCAEEGKYGIAKASRQGRGTLDAVTVQLNKEFPSLRTQHIHPGVVLTNVMNNSDLPYWIVLATNLLYPLLVVTIGNSATSYAEIPVYLAANEKNKEEATVFSNHKFIDCSPEWVTEEPDVVKAVWDKMLEITGV